MPASTPSSLRYRPAILICTGAAAAYAAYLIYSAVQAHPGHGLHRSNALRRRPRRRESAAARVLALAAASSEQERSTSLGTYAAYGISLPLSPDALATVEELHQSITQARPDLTEQQVKATIIDFYDSFLDRLLGFMFNDQAPSVSGVDAIRASYGDVIPDPAAIELAVQRHTERLVQGGGSAVEGGDSIAGTELSWGGSEDDSDDDTLNQSGQTLQRTLYHIAEDRARQEGVVHRGITCNGCDEKPIRGIRWHCANCVDFDLCSNCEATNSHYKTHIFYKVRVPAPHLCLQKQEPLYPGTPHLMSPSIEPALKKRLVSETKMEAEEIEALWDQFTCLAGCRWKDDPSNVGYALDRRAFNHAFVPRYNSFTAAPNLVYDRIFACYDTDQNGLIGFDEWIKGIAGMHTTDVEAKARIIFNGYDIDGDGYIARRDLLRIFRAYYAIEKEATKNYVAEITEEYSPRNQMEKIHSSQPLGSAFTPNNMASTEADVSLLNLKQQDDDVTTLPVLGVVGSSDFATRDHVLKRLFAENGSRVTSESNRAVTERWDRREFYVDEEEGMTRPGGPPNAINEEAAEPSQQPEMSHLEKFGGYDVPQPEKELGKEVLYQVTQQGFNELLDPIFQEKEDLAMDVYNTRSLRRENAAAINAMQNVFETYKADAELIAQIGFFRYSKGVVEMFCEQFNFSCREGLMQEAIRVEGTSYFDREIAKMVLYRLYASNEGIMHRALKAQMVRTAGYKEPDAMTLWNILLCMLQLREEILHATFECVSRLGWFDDESPCTDQDPTLPQFRSNSATDAYTTWNPNGASCSQDQDSRPLQQPSVYGYKRPITQYQFPIHWRNETGHYVESAVTGPFFVYTDPTATRFEEEEEEATEGDECMEPPSIYSPSTPPTTDAPRLASRLASDAPTVDPSAPGPGHDMPDTPILNWHAHTNSPAMHIFSIPPPTPGEDPTDHAPILSSHATLAGHSDAMPYHHSLNHFKPLVRRIRQRAMDPASKLHVTMLASLELVEQEMHARRGGGRIGFDEFAAHLREGKMKFLESWMEWVSI